MSICLALRPDTKVLFKQMDKLAATADYDIDVLHQFAGSSAVYRCRETVYYLASLYLQSGEYEAAKELLSQPGTASNAMKRYFHVLSYSRQNNLAVPRLTNAEERCVGNLEVKVNPVTEPFALHILNSGGFSVVGNAPGASFQQKHEGVRLYFNSYKNNKRITNTASVHVVTPSWNRSLTSGADIVCITGNDIFYRRSRVWQKFIGDTNIAVIYTAPAHLWRSLYAELGTSPSAGLLILGWVESIAARNAGKLVGYVSGFSSSRPEINHSYDAVPPSDRHNWEMEKNIRQRLLDSLSSSCLSLSIEA